MLPPQEIGESQGGAPQASIEPVAEVVERYFCRQPGVVRAREASGPGRTSAGKLALQKSSTMTYNVVRKVSASSTVSSFVRRVFTSLSYRVTFLSSYNSHQAFHSIPTLPRRKNGVSRARKSRNKS